MPMSGIAADLERAERAFARPTLSLLGRKNASVVVAVFSQVFSQQRHHVPAEEFHVLVENLLHEVRAGGTDCPDEPARALGRRWVAEGWLVLAGGQGGGEVYALTSHARDAIDYVYRLSGDRSVFGQSRIRTIVEAARRCAMDADPDTDARLARLDEQIAQLRAERDRLAGLPGPAAVPIAAQIVEQYLNVRDLTAQLPADFLRLSEHVTQIHRSVVDEFRQEGRRSGEVLDLYLQRSATLMSESLEGKAFLGAVELLRDEALMDQLRRDIDIIVAHPFARSQPAAEIAAFRNTVASVRRGVTTVLEAQRRLSSTLRAYITSHDALRDRELDEVLREAKKELARWMEVSGPRARVPVEMAVSGLQIGNTRERFYDPAEHAPPPPLAGGTDEGAEVPSLDVLRQKGGPSVVALRLAVAHATGHHSVSAAAVFGALPEELRRPAEIFGLMQLAAVLGAFGDDTDSSAGDVNVDGDGGDGEAEVVEAVRADGSRRPFLVPPVMFGQRHRDELMDGIGAGHDGSG